jgi:hypothetical protein
MFYRTDLLLHSRRVPAILERLLPVAVASIPGFNPELALILSKHHDDHELIPALGDVPLQLKLLMDNKKLSALKESEIEAARMISLDYGNPMIGDYRYIDLLMHAITKDCAEAQLHSLADKIDGFCEALHEVLAGNLAFLEAVINYISKTFNDLPKNFPLLAPVFGPQNEFFNFPVVQLKPYFQLGKVGAFLHTQQSILEMKTGVVHYELWKSVTLSLVNGMDRLTKQVEFHNKQSELRLVGSIKSKRLSA